MAYKADVVNKDTGMGIHMEHMDKIHKSFPSQGQPRHPVEGSQSEAPGKEPMGKAPSGQITIGPQYGY